MINRKRMKFSSKIFFVAAGLLALGCLGPEAVANEDVSVNADINATIRQGILPVRIESADTQLGAAVRRALKFHGAFDTEAPARSAAIIRLVKSGNTLSATSSGASKAFSGTLSVSGTSEAAIAELCDKIVVAVGKNYAWDLKPIFSKTKVAFSSTRSGEREIYFSDLLFRQIKQATHHKRIAIMPHWAPSGKRLLYTTYHASGAADVYSVDLNSGRTAKFAAYPNTNNGGAFSPDGSRVALALSARGVMNIYVKPAQGGQAVSLCRDAEVQTSPVFSPDGKTVIFTSGPNGRPGLYSVPAQGGKKSRIALSGFSYVTDPAWSKAAPTKIAFAYMRYGKSGIGIYDTRAKTVRDLGERVAGNHKLSNPTWCADGRHVIAVEEAGKQSFLVVLDTDGGDRAKLTRLSPASLKNCYDPDALVSD